MKKILFILFISGICWSQDLSVIEDNTPYYHDTLTATIDTIDIAFSDLIPQSYITISCYTTTGTDTIDVYNQSLDGLIWSKVGVNDLTIDTVSTQIIITTTPKEYQILSPNVFKTRLITPDHSASIVFTVNAKKD